jgi:ankyrin repeat protein
MLFFFSLFSFLSFAVPHNNAVSSNSLICENSYFTLDLEGYSPLHQAGIKKKIDLIIIFIRDLNADPEQKDARGNNFFHLFLDTEEINLEGLEKITSITPNLNSCLSVPNSEGNNVLHIALLRRNIPLVKFLIEKKHIDPEVKNKDENTFLHLMAINKNDQAVFLEILDFLKKEKKLSVFYVKNKDGNTVFHLLAIENCIDVLSLCLDFLESTHFLNGSRETNPFLAVNNDKKNLMHLLVSVEMTDSVKSIIRKAKQIISLDMAQVEDKRRNEHTEIINVRLQNDPNVRIDRRCVVDNISGLIWGMNPNSRSIVSDRLLDCPNPYVSDEEFDRERPEELLSMSNLAFLAAAAEMAAQVDHTNSTADVSLVKKRSSENSLDEGSQNQIKENSPQMSNLDFLAAAAAAEMMAQVDHTSSAADMISPKKRSLKKILEEEFQDEAKKKIVDQFFEKGINQENIRPFFEKYKKMIAEKMRKNQENRLERDAKYLKNVDKSKKNFGASVLGDNLKKARKDRISFDDQSKGFIVFACFLFLNDDFYEKLHDFVLHYLDLDKDAINKGNFLSLIKRMQGDSLLDKYISKFFLALDCLIQEYNKNR